MNLQHAYIPSCTNQNFVSKNVEGKKYRTNPFSHTQVSCPIRFSPFSRIGRNMFLSEKHNPLRIYKNKTLSFPFNLETRMNTRRLDDICLNNKRSIIARNCSERLHYSDSTNGHKGGNGFKIGNGLTSANFQMGHVLDFQGVAQSAYKPQQSEGLCNLHLLRKKVNNNSQDIYLEKCRRVIIFDLDDTLVPTCWIRSMMMCKYNINYDQALKELKKEIKLNKNCNFESAVCSVINLAMSMSHTVFIVTNARSDKWVDTVKWLFPRFSKLLEECHIPIIRTEQYREPSPLNVFEYFRYWMNAKKKKFDDILKEHCNFYRQYIANKIDFISLGDTDFEEVATQELLSSNKSLIKKAFNVKVQAGLCLENFVGQLKLVQVALSIIAKGSYAYKYLALSGSVQIKMFQ
ncbi:conserved Plasmodium protein, unknown function [Plasmodium ovale]|uniref:Uncharacterized protein n=2 Tax=Plasmodium ovale TaxID=36330 RepID=A0A1A8VRD1_PLAOA|nr:conserved Plasmodium protein, unknown function [Plasmodium ovale curtisi]SBS83074.1 conserved Plasmodium protein, unknown function [Plasmodium ovale curtisi]SCA48704.1 conserved Plasmodium protein, unknown function [Plasmodium ovale]